MSEWESSQVDSSRQARILGLAAGLKEGGDRAMCTMEAAVYGAGEHPTDQLACASVCICAFVRTWNDGLLQAERDGLILPIVPRLIGTNGSAHLEGRRVAMVADWLVRTHLPAWFRLAKLNVEADDLADLPELTDIAELKSLCDHLKRARKRAAVANLTLRQTGSAVRAAAWDATQQAAWITVRDALEDAGAPVLATGWDATYAAAYAAARAYGKASLEPTRLALQQSALALVERMIELRDTAETDAVATPVRAQAHPDVQP